MHTFEYRHHPKEVGAGLLTEPMIEEPDDAHSDGQDAQISHQDEEDARDAEQKVRFAKPHHQI